jgi:hypothetical protein
MIDPIVRLVTREAAPAGTPLPPGVCIRSARWIPVLGGLLSGSRRAAAAVALGRTIIVHPGVPLSPRLIRHELAHVRQWQEYPLSFPLRYAWNHLRHGYRSNPFEVEARRAEEDAGTSSADRGPGGPHPEAR